MAEDIRAIVERAGQPPGTGHVPGRRRDGTAPAWVHDNLESIEVIEQKQFNRHRWLENLRLAVHGSRRASSPDRPPRCPVRQEPTLDGG
jgi:hypothetical protein